MTDNYLKYVPLAQRENAAVLDLRETALRFASSIREQCGPCDERNLALQRLEEAAYWANCALMRGALPSEATVMIRDERGEGLGSVTCRVTPDPIRPGVVVGEPFTIDDSGRPLRAKPGT